MRAGGGGGEAEERWDVLSERRGEDEKEIREEEEEVKEEEEEEAEEEGARSGRTRRPPHQPEVASNNAESPTAELRLPSSCVSAVRSVPAAGSCCWGESRSPCMRFIFLARVLCPTEQSEKEERWTADTSSGFGTAAQHSSTERSAEESDPVRCVSPLLLPFQRIPGSLLVALLYPGTSIMHSENCFHLS